MTDALERFERAVKTLRAAPAPEPRGWTLPQAIAHCAQSIECSMTAYPKLRSGLFRATIGPIVKRKFIRNARMSHDVTAPIVGAPDIAADVTLTAACDRADAALTAFAAHSGPLAPHLAYGTCTKDEYAQLHWLHFDEHLRAFGIAS
jgi:Protein of unknown function (DUF1569)